MSEMRAPKPEKKSQPQVKAVRPVQHAKCQHCGKTHRSVATEVKCKNRFEARAARLLAHPEIPKAERVVCPICGKIHRTVSALDRCLARPVAKITPCPVCGKRHRKLDVAAKCLAKLEAKAKADRIFEIAQQL
jgi:hypothetical protein